MKFLIFGCMLISVVCKGLTETLCEPDNSNYKIGQSTTILDIDAADISALSGVCTREITLAGARLSELDVVSADFGQYKYYIYNGLVGTQHAISSDKLFVSFGRCSSTAKGYEFQIQTGGHRRFLSEVLCFHFVPEIRYRNLGTYAKGGRVHINVTIVVAVCAKSSKEQDGCEALCNADGELHNCDTFHTGSSTSTSTSLSPRPSFQTLSMTPPSAGVPRSSTVTTSAERGKPTIRPTLGKLSTRRTVSTSNFGTNPTTSTTISPSHESLTSSNPITNPHNITSGYIPTVLKTTIQISTRTKSETSLDTRGQLSTTAQLTTFKPDTIPELRVTTRQHTTASELDPSLTLVATTINVTASTLETKSNSGQDKAVFGLVEGLYIIVGFIVLLLLLGVAGICIRKRSNKSVSAGGTFSGSLPRSALHWRDNWLVRYHNNSIDNVSIGEIDSSIEYIHGEFVTQPTNTELHHIHHDNLKTGLSKPEDVYHDPWPLVRLDSEFVRTAKQIERERSCADEHSENLRTDNTETAQSAGREQESGDRTSNNITSTETSDVKNDHNEAHSFQLRMGSTVLHKGRYDVAKVERSHSKNSGKWQPNVKFDRKQNEHSQTQLESHQVLRKESCKINRRQRNSSSICSDCSVTFEELLKDEIHNIENALDHEGNFDTESVGSDRTTGSQKRSWKVNTLYAIVSPRNAPNSKDVVPSRNHSRKRIDSSRSDSHKKPTPTDDRASRVRAVALPKRSKSMCNERSQPTNSAKSEISKLEKARKEASDPAGKQSCNKERTVAVPHICESLASERSQLTNSAKHEASNIEKAKKEASGPADMQTSSGTEKQRKYEYTEAENVSGTPFGYGSATMKVLATEETNLGNTEVTEHSEHLNETESLYMELSANEKADKMTEISDRAEKEAKHREFLKNREKFEKNVSITVDKMPNGVTGTGQFAK